MTKLLEIQLKQSELRKTINGLLVTAAAARKKLEQETPTGTVN